MSYTPAKSNTESGFTLDGIHRVAQGITLFDGKIYGAENPNRWDVKGTGDAAYSNNTISMNVTAGQYLVRQGTSYCPYFSGKPTKVEPTSFAFHNEVGLTKRIGYFSSSAAAPYDTALDGFWIEADGATHRLICSNNGTITHNIAMAQWDNYSAIASYDWSKFTVMSMDFLWLGGAGLRFFMVVNGVFVLVHTIDDHAGYAEQLICLTPQQPVRYEIRSTTGVGSLTSVCSQVTTEGAVAEQGQNIIAATNVSLASNTTGENYVVVAARKTSAHRNAHVVLDRMSLGITSATNDSGMMLLCLNPTFNEPLTWVPNGSIEEAIPPASSRALSLGTVLGAYPIVSSGSTALGPSSSMSTLTVGIDDSMGVLALVYRPLTSNQAVSGSLMFLEY